MTDAKEQYDWNMETNSVLSLVDTFLSKLIKDWEIFTAPGGDVGYLKDTDSFSDDLERSACGSFAVIREKYQELGNLRDLLLNMKEACLGRVEAVGCGFARAAHIH